MKLIINYDLVNEIRKANTGFDLKRFGLKMSLYTGFTLPVTLSTQILNPSAFHATSLISSYLYAIFVFGGPELVLKELNKKQSYSTLSMLASSLTKINIYTDADSIKKAYLYKTQYKIVRDSKSIQQNKFIMLPTDGTFNADEVSLQQEHIIGAKEYVLSIGEPKKAGSKVYSRAFARQI